MSSQILNQTHEINIETMGEKYKNGAIGLLRADLQAHSIDLSFWADKDATTPYCSCSLKLNQSPVDKVKGQPTLKHFQQGELLSIIWEMIERSVLKYFDSGRLHNSNTHKMNSFHEFNICHKMANQSGQPPLTLFASRRAPVFYGFIKLPGMPINDRPQIGFIFNRTTTKILLDGNVFQSSHQQMQPPVFPEHFQNYNYVETHDQPNYFKALESDFLRLFNESSGGNFELDHVETNVTNGFAPGLPRNKGKASLSNGYSPTINPILRGLVPSSQGHISGPEQGSPFQLIPSEQVYGIIRDELLNILSLRTGFLGMELIAGEDRKRGNDVTWIKGTLNGALSVMNAIGTIMGSDLVETPSNDRDRLYLYPIGRNEDRWTKMPTPSSCVNTWSVPLLQSLLRLAHYSFIYKGAENYIADEDQNNHVGAFKGPRYTSNSDPILNTSLKPNASAMDKLNALRILKPWLETMPEGILTAVNREKIITALETTKFDPLEPF